MTEVQAGIYNALSWSKPQAVVDKYGQESKKYRDDHG